MLNEEQIVSKMEELSKFKYDMGEVSNVELLAWANSILNTFKLILPTNSYQIQNLEKVISEYLAIDYYKPFQRLDFREKCSGILLATYRDYKEGFLIDLRTEIRAEADADFLSQANRLLKEKLKNPAAMLTGAVLEDALRQLCIKFEVKEGSNIESMNVPLRKAGAYGLPAQQQVTAWAAIRNKADHARFEEYDIKEVRLMHQGVNDFIVKHLT